MKRTLILLAGVVAFGTAIYVGNRVLAQTASSTATTPAATTMQPKTKVGLLNLTYVIKHYNKFKTYQEDLKATVAPFQAKDAGWKMDGEKMAKEATNPATQAARREEIEKKLKELQRLIEDNKAEAQKAIGKKQEEQLKTLYMDIRGVVERYAPAHGFEMVLHYNDALTTEDYFSGPNIARKVQSGALIPMYIAQGLDISAPVLSTLNAQVPAPAAAATGARPASNR